MVGPKGTVLFKLHSLKQSWKWTIAPWMTIFSDKQVLFHFHFREGIYSIHFSIKRTTSEGVGLLSQL